MLTWDQKKELSEEMGISVGFVHDILTRRKPCPGRRALSMGAAYYKLFNVYVPFWEFTFNMVSTNPVFGAVDYRVLKRIEETLYGDDKPGTETKPA